MPPFDREGTLKNAEKALRQGRIDVAIQEYVRLVQAQPRDWNSANQLGDLYVRAGQVDKGIAEYTRIADQLGNEGFYPKAAALYKKILKIKPMEEYALLQSGELAFRQGLLVDAKAAFRTVAERRRAKGDKKGAAEIQIKLGGLDPEDIDARLIAARAAAEIGETLSAIREFRDVGFKLEKQGRAEDALSAFQQAFEINPQDDEVRGRLLAGYLSAGDFTRARTVATDPSDLKHIASALDAAGRGDEALDVLGQVAALDPGDLQVRGLLAQAYAARGDLERARTYLNPTTAGRNGALWMTLAEIELGAGSLDEGRAAVVEALGLEPDLRDTALALGSRLIESSPDAAYRCLDAAAEASTRRGDFADAAAALQAFVSRVPHNVIGLMRLVEICVDGGLETMLYEAQAQLADAYLEVGRAMEARIISEDLVAREPWNRDHVERFRRALVMSGEADPEAIISERLSGESPFLGDDLDLNEGTEFERQASDAARPAAREPVESAASRDFGAEAEEAVVSFDAPPVQNAPADADEELVIDLDAALDLGGLDLNAPDPPPPAGASAPAPRSLDQVFKQMRDEVGRGSAEEAAAEAYRLALTYRDLGMVEDAIASLEQAARSPRQRFDACSLLGRIYLEREDTVQAVEWFERAAEAPAPTADAGRALLYDLAETLERVGEHARALAVFVELESESGGYRDVARRIERLSKVQAKG